MPVVFTQPDEPPKAEPELKPEDDPTTFFERADEALYAAKERGKAQVVASTAG